MTYSPIADYAFISDRHGSALINRNGSIDWLCMPSFDSPSIFGRLIGDDAGFWSIRPTEEVVATTRKYVDATMVVETTVETASGAIVLTDALLLGKRNKGHRIGVGAPHVLARRVVCSRGSVEMVVEYAPRPEYGLVVPVLESTQGCLRAHGGATVLTLSSEAEFDCDVPSGVATARFSLSSGEQRVFALAQQSLSDPDVKPASQRSIKREIKGTIRAWESWSKLHQTYRGPWQEQVHHSGRVLQALSYQPTGAIIAAPTTSLPERVGGSSNWDYRFTWVRDASLTLEALWIAACPEESAHFFNFLAQASARQMHDGQGLQIMYGIDGRHDLSERELTGLSGWRNSLPVRVGNDAWNQRQLDVYGELLAAAASLTNQLGDLPESTKAFLVSAADAAAEHWMQPDQGIWELRGEPQDFVYSKLMCWVALDRAVKLATFLAADERVEHWTRVAEEIRAAILTRGWSDRANAFTQAFDSDELDASNLVMSIVGFLPGDDDQIVKTIDAIREGLTDANGLVYRFGSHAGDDDSEGTFLLCTFWLAQSLALAGRIEEATETFERAASFANDVGLLSEEVDAISKELLGNFPQGFSHIGLINAAFAISEAKDKQAPK